MIHKSSARTRRRWIPAWLELAFLTIGAAILFFAGASILWAIVTPIPAIDNFQSRAVAQSTKIYDRTGQTLLYDVHGAVRRTVVPLDEISPFVQKATISIEDVHFYEHHGFRPTAFIRAMLADLMSGSYEQGGSTITQQVVKNALLTQDKTILRKLKEIVLALRLERVYPKDQILSVYLNENPYGGTIYGVEEASQYFFGVAAKDVDLAQAAYLAALPQAPTYYSPYGNHRDALDARKNLVLSKMKENGYITDAEYSQAKDEKVQFRQEVEAGIKAPHFVFYIREYLEQKYGVDMVDKGGLRVITTLDYDLQQKAEDIVTRNALSNEKNFNASNAGLVAIDPKTGQILTMVGSRGYFDTNIDGAVNVTLAKRQPGSSFKPFVYATAFKKGYTPETVVFDLKTQFSTACAPDNLSSDDPCYSPENYDEKFAGPITFRNALAQSKNIPAVKALYLAGISDSIKTAEDMGITTLEDAGRYGLTLVLGGGEVTLLEETSAYSVFANDGVKNPATGILRIEDMDGNVLESYEDKSERVLDPQVSREITDILSDNVARTPEFGANSPLYFANADIADKTGTTNDYRDTWVVGYSTALAVGTWAGNNDNTPMEKKIAAFIVTPMWHEFFEYAMTKYPGEPFPAPAPDPGGDSIPAVLRGEWNTDPARGIHSILFWVKKDDPRGGAPNNPYSDPQFTRWEYAVQQWAAGQGAAGPASAGSSANEPFRIVSPQAGAFIQAGTRVTFLAAGNDIASVTYYMGDIAIGSSNVAPFSVSTVPRGRGPTVVRAVAQTTTGATTEATESVVVQ